MIYCSQCKKANVGESNFCSQCGAKLNEYVSEVAKISPTSSAGYQSNEEKFLYKGYEYRLVSGTVVDVRVVPKVKGQNFIKSDIDRRVDGGGYINTVFITTFFIKMQNNLEETFSVIHKDMEELVIGNGNHMTVVCARKNSQSKEYSYYYYNHNTNKSFISEDNLDNLTKTFFGTYDANAELFGYLWMLFCAGLIVRDIWFTGPGIWEGFKFVFSWKSIGLILFIELMLFLFIYLPARNSKGILKGKAEEILEKYKKKQV